jgi:hypothetical protein
MHMVDLPAGYVSWHSDGFQNKVGCWYHSYNHLDHCNYKRDHGGPVVLREHDPWEDHLDQDLNPPGGAVLHVLEHDLREEREEGEEGDTPGDAWMDQELQIQEMWMDQEPDLMIDQNWGLQMDDDDDPAA